MALALNKHAILIIASVASLAMLLAVGGLETVRAQPVSVTHGHTHMHVHDGVAHVHWHAHVGYEDTCNETIFLPVAQTEDGHDCCCHHDHSHPKPIHALANSSQRWDDLVSSLVSPLPELWQPAASTSPPPPPSPPPRGDPGESLYQLRTVVLLT